MTRQVPVVSCQIPVIATTALSSMDGCKVSHYTELPQVACAGRILLGLRYD